MDIKIRTVKPEDLDLVTAAEAECFPAAEAAGRADFERRIKTFPESFLIAEKVGRIIGFINGCVTDETAICDEMYEDEAFHRENGAYQSVFGLDVIPGERNQGVAELLMRALMERARAAGRKGMILTCKDRLIHYYEKFGYVNYGVSGSVHGNVVWYDMRLEFGQR